LWPAEAPVSAEQARHELGPATDQNGPGEADRGAEHEAREERKDNIHIAMP
jgi:hypothetical protein